MWGRVGGCYYNLDQPFKLVYGPFDFLVVRVDYDFGTDMLVTIITLSAEDTVACSSSEICKRDTEGVNLIPTF